MHILALNHVYRPSEAATAQLLTELCEALAARGHEVTVVTAAMTADAPIEAEENGVRVRRIRGTRLGKDRLWRRAADYASFYAGAAAALATRAPRADVILALSTPPLVVAAAELAARPWGTPIVHVVQDLYPDVAVAVGAVRAGGLVHRAWARATRATLAGATRVVAISQAMRQRLIGYGVAPERIDVIPNWALAELEVAPIANAGAEKRLEYGIGERFAVMYSGNLGAGHTFETLIAAARRLAGRSDIAFVFVGDGVRRAEVARLADGLPNVKMLPLAPRDAVADSLAAGDLHVVTLRDGLDGVIVPSKIYGILAAARPTLFIGPRDDDLARLVADAGAGHALADGDVDGVVAAISHVAGSADRGRALGARGRAHLLETLARDHAIARYEATLVAAARRQSPSHDPFASARHADARSRRS